MGVVSKKVGVAYDFSRELRAHHYTRTPHLEILDPPLRSSLTPLDEILCIIDTQSPSTKNITIIVFLYLLYTIMWSTLIN